MNKQTFLNALTGVAFCFAALLMGFQPDDGLYLQDSSNHCMVFNPAPGRYTNVIYEGGCNDKMAEGQGKVQWFTADDKLAMKYTGEFRQGKMEGQGEGVFIEGNYTFVGLWNKGLPFQGKTTYKDDETFVGRDGKSIGMYDFVPTDKDASCDVQELQRLIIYPETVKMMGIQGKVTMRFLVDWDGIVKKVVIEKSDHVLLNAAAVNAILQVHFTPAVNQGKPIAVWMSQPVIFKFKDKKE